MPSVLIVDDEPMICKYLSNKYKQEGYDTLTATNGKDALSICKINSPDVIVTDVNMPDTSGVDLIQDIKHFNNYTPVILFITAYYDLSSQEINNMGVNALFNKPFKFGEILDATNKFLEKKDANYLPLPNKELPAKVPELPNFHNFTLSEQVILISEISSGIIHNINNHITYISTSCYILNKYFQELQIKNPTDDLSKRHFNITEKMQNHINIVLKIIKSIKMLAYPNTENSKKENVKIIEMIQNSTFLLEDLFKTNQITCNINCNDEINLFCFPEQIVLVFVCLIKNSCEAIAANNLEEKWINIHVSKLNNEIELAFTDSGNGINKDIITQIMQPFYTTKKRGEGIGVSLSICKKILDLHNGTIIFDETSKNTKFVIKFSNI